MRADRVVLGDVHEAPMPRVRPEDLREALSLCDCQGVARSGDLAVKVSVRAMHAMEKASIGVAPLSCIGALLGTVYQVGENWLVDVQEALPFGAATSEMHRVRVPRHAWQEMLAQRKASFPEMRIVGWYHSHPGVGASMSDCDAFVQRFFFPADWQVACVVDPHRRDTQFFSRRGRNVSPLGAYWVERGVGESARADDQRKVGFPNQRAGVPEASDAHGHKNGGRSHMPQPEVLEVEQASETYLKDRFVQRSLEKIMRLLKEPPLTLRDFVMMGMMGLLLVVLIFTRVSASSSSAELKDIAQKLEAISARLEALQPSAAPAQRTAAPRKPAAASPLAQKGPAEGEPDVEHVMQPGETLYGVAEQYYGDGSLMNGLMRYNKVTDPRDLRAGTTIKVPSVSRLTGGAPTSNRPGAPTPTPH